MIEVTRLSKLPKLVEYLLRQKQDEANRGQGLERTKGQKAQVRLARASFAFENSRVEVVDQDVVAAEGFAVHSAVSAEAHFVVGLGSSQGHAIRAELQILG